MNDETYSKALIFELVDMHLRQRDIADTLVQKFGRDEKILARLEEYLEKLEHLDGALKKTIDSVEFLFEEELYRKLSEIKRRDNHDR